MINISAIFNAQNPLVWYSCSSYSSQGDERISKSHTRPVITGDEWIARHDPSTSGWRQPDDATTYQSYWSTYSACHIQPHTKVHHTYALLKEKSKYIYIIRYIFGEVSSNSNINTFTRDTKIMKNWLIECLLLLKIFEYLYTISDLLLLIIYIYVYIYLAIFTLHKIISM